jgi:DNA topoisomerase III
MLCYFVLCCALVLHLPSSPLLSPAHPPIHPTRSVPLDSLTDPQEKQLYELISRHFLACCAPDATGQQTTLRVQMSRQASEVMPGFKEEKEEEEADCMDIDSSNDPGLPRGAEEVAWLLDGEVFKATGLMVEERNWLDVYSKWEKWSGSKVAPLRVGDVFRPQGMQMKASRTQPPQALTESDLISEMDRHGIGTDGNREDAAVLCCVVLCCVVLCCAIWCGAVLCCAVIPYFFDIILIIFFYNMF